jgi:DNA-K related protein/Hsp70 protein
VSDRQGSTRAPRYVVGIDLGTTNSALGWADGRADGPEGRGIALLPIPQLVADGEVAPRDSLPSAVYLAGEHDVRAGALALPWSADERFAVGAHARRLGARIAGRLVTSAKSWLCHGGVDRTQPVLPWGASADAPRLSPVEASARILAHLRDAWLDAHPDSPLAEQEVVLTVPASFDEVARELTVRAASEAGLPRLRLLEEPQAAIYAWIASHTAWREELRDVRLLLVVDVGGGTTDFSLLRVRRDADGLALERVAVGDHLLLGGDNMDVALARGFADEQAAAAGLDAARWQQLVDQCREAKERLLGGSPPGETVVSIPGRGRGVIHGAISGRLTGTRVIEIVRDGFFPMVALDAKPREQVGLALAEFGLPYASDPEITRHLAAFLSRAGSYLEELPPSADEAGGGTGGRDPEVPASGRHAVRPDAVLFNGGALKPRALRERILDALASWYGTRPRELAGADLELAVARGAAAYGLALRGAGVRIRGGAARSYYVGLDPATKDEASPAEAGDQGGTRRVLCIAPRGMEEADSIDISSSEFEVLANAPVRFPIYASSVRVGEAGGAIVDADPATLVELPPITTVLRYGRSLQARGVRVRLRSQLTETGTLELWCLAQTTGHRWRMSFDLRGAVRDAGAVAGAPSGPQEDDGADAGGAASGPPSRRAELVVDPERIAAACSLLEACFGPAGAVDPVGLTRSLEETLGAAKDAWPLACIRELWDALIGLERGRARTPAHEARWLNLAGFLLRPGFGESRDPWRAEQLWRLYDRGLAAPGAAQARAEWWTLWKRAAGGLTRQQQQVIHQEIRPLLVPEARKKAKAGRWRSGPQELREMWQVAGALERLAAGAKLELLRALAPRVLAGRAGDAEIWAFGRLGARAPVYGPANAVVAPSAVEGWLADLAAAPWPRPAPTALAVAQVARVTGDRVRDLTERVRALVAARLDRETDGEILARWAREHVGMGAHEQALILAESLPVGLRIASDDDELDSASAP